MTVITTSGGHAPARDGAAAAARLARPARPVRLDPLVTVLAPAAWGLTYIVTTELLPPDRPLLAGTLRALPAGLALAAVTRYRPIGGWWIRAAVLGVLNIGAFFALLFVAAYRLPGGVAATLGSVQPLIAAGLASVALKERFRPATAVAGVLGVAGVALLVLRAGAALDAVGVVAGVAGAVSMATGVVLTKRWGRPVPLVAFTSWQLIAGGLLLLPVAVAVEGAPPSLDGRNLAGFAWLAIGGTAIPYVLWFRGVARLPVGQVSLLGLASPVVATIAGFVVLGQTLTAAQVVGVVLVLTAIGIGQRPERPAMPPERRPVVAHRILSASDRGTPVVAAGHDPQTLTGMRRSASAGARSRFRRQRPVPLLATPDGADLEQVLDLVGAGDVRPVVGATVDLSDVDAGVRRVEAGHVAGTKVVTT